MTFLFKEIKPSRMKEDALRLTLLNELRKTGTQVRRDFEGTTRTWKRKPRFKQEISLAGPGPVLMVYTDDEIYGYVSRGTRPHMIWAGAYTGRSRAKALAYPVRSSPKTRPGMLRSMTGFRSSAKRYRAYVHHPGTRPRRFEEAIQKKWQRRFKRQMERAMRQAARSTGHGI